MAYVHPQTFVTAGALWSCDRGVANALKAKSTPFLTWNMSNWTADLSRLLKVIDSDMTNQSSSCDFFTVIHINYMDLFLTVSEIMGDFGQNAHFPATIFTLPCIHVRLVCDKRQWLSAKSRLLVLAPLLLLNWSVAWINWVSLLTLLLPPLPFS